jgi:ATP-dependent Clp protease protease subunit
MAEPGREGRGGERYLYLFGEMTDEQTQAVVEKMLASWQQEFVLVINSDGGSSFNALALVNLIRLHGRVDTLCIGVALSGAADCLAAGRRRLIVPNAIAMIHQVSWELGNEFTANLLKNARFLERLNDHLTELLAEDTGQPVARLNADMTTDHYLFGQEIIDYGLADSFFDPLEFPAFRPRSRGGRRVAEELQPRRGTRERE